MDVDEDSDSDIEIIDLHICQGKIFVWNSKDVKIMRETHHIIGSLVGGLPRAPRQNSQMGLPLQLMPEEVNVLLEYGAARIVNVRPHRPSAKNVEKFENDRKDNFLKQQELWKTRQAQKKQELSHIIELGRMSRKQRRAEKAMRKRQMKETVKSTLSLHGDSKPNLCNQTDVKDAASNQEISAKMEQEGSKSTSTHAVEMLDKRGTCAARLDQPESSMPVNDGCDRSGENLVSKSVNAVCERADNQGSCKQKTKNKCDIGSDGIGMKQTVVEQASALPVGTTNAVCSQMDTVPSSAGRTTSYHKDGNIDDKSDTDITACQEMEQLQNANHKLGENGNLKVETEMVATSSKETDASSNHHKEQHSTQHSNPLINASKTQSIGFSNQKDRSYTAAENVVPVDGEPSQKKLKFSGPDTMQQRSKDSGSTDKEIEDQGCLVQIFTGTPNLRESYCQPVSWKYPVTPHEVLRCRIFRSFWEQGYYLTSGSKFGGDFLVYPGDPFLYHSLYVVVCLPYKKPISPLDIVTFGRMASNVKKSIVLCSVDETDEVVYTSVQWTGFS